MLRALQRVEQTFFIYPVHLPEISVSRRNNSGFEALTLRRPASLQRLSRELLNRQRLSPAIISYHLNN